MNTAVSRRTPPYGNAYLQKFVPFAFPTHILILIVDPQGHKILRELFPDWMTLSSEDEICAVCEALLHISKEDKREIRKQAEDEKVRCNSPLRKMHSILS